MSEEQTDLNGHKWKLFVKPGGDTRNTEPGWISLFLHNENTDKLNVKFTIAVNNVNGATAKEEQFEYYFVKKIGYGGREIMKRSDILDTSNSILQNGTLCIEVTIQVKDDKEHLYQPESEHSIRMLTLLKSKKNTDTSFQVGSKEFRVHSVIIDTHVPLLGNQCKDVIKNITPEVFQLLLEHIYSGNQPTDEMILEHGKALIDAANKYELIELKMIVESVLVRERIITKKNVADYILFADAQSCPLLKEYALSFFLMHYKELLKSEHSKRLRDSGELMTEIMMLMDPNENKAVSMSVNELRKELAKRKLDADGSKDALVARLEEAKRQRTE